MRTTLHAKEFLGRVAGQHIQINSTIRQHIQINSTIHWPLHALCDDDDHGDAPWGGSDPVFVFAK